MISEQKANTKAGVCRSWLGSNFRIRAQPRQKFGQDDSNMGNQGDTLIATNWARGVQGVSERVYPATFCCLFGALRQEFSGCPATD
jgi:hypothetical protein